MFLAEVTQAAADIFFPYDFGDVSRIFLLHGVRSRTVAVKSLLDGFGSDAGVGVVQWLDHVVKNAEEFFGLDRRRDLRSKLLVHHEPISLAQREKWIVLRETLPEDLIIRERRIRQSLSTGFGPRRAAAEQNARDAAVYVEPASILRGSRRDAERVVTAGEDDLVGCAHTVFVRRLEGGDATQRCDLRTAQVVSLEFDEGSISVGEP